MRFKNSFVVDAPPEDAWKVLLDVAKIAPCVPGGELTEIVDPTHFKGRARVKVGPIELAFNGQAEFASIDNANHKARLIAKGNDSKGRGNASATIDFELVPDGAGSLVTASTDLNMTGPIAQYGRGAGIMNEVANHLTAAFAQNLSDMIAREKTHVVSPESSTAPPKAAAPISAFALLAAVWRASLLRLFGRIFGRAKP
ncbi:MAG: SRPBCC family protein [Rhodomicrobium sp.]